MDMKPTLEVEGNSLVINVPMKFKRRGGRKEIIVPEGLKSSAAQRLDAQESLLTALAKAHLWKDLLDSGKILSISELAQRLGLDQSYIARTLRLSYLAPDIIEDIARGNEPSGLSLAKLHKGIPLLWEEQRMRFAFPEK
jgi:hypothetical protein